MCSSYHTTILQMWVRKLAVNLFWCGSWSLQRCINHLKPTRFETPFQVVWGAVVHHRCYTVYKHLLCIVKNCSVSWTFVTKITLLRGWVPHPKVFVWSSHSCILDSRVPIWCKARYLGDQYFCRHSQGSYQCAEARSIITPGRHRSGE